MVEGAGRDIPLDSRVLLVAQVAAVAPGFLAHEHRVKIVQWFPAVRDSGSESGSRIRHILQRLGSPCPSAVGTRLPDPSSRSFIRIDLSCVECALDIRELTDGVSHLLGVTELCSSRLDRLF